MSKLRTIRKHLIYRLFAGLIIIDLNKNCP
jgi:hypothetical protein